MKKIIIMLVLFSLLLPCVLANVEILDGRSYKECANHNCNITFYGVDKFPEVNNKFYFFEDYITSNVLFDDSVKLQTLNNESFDYVPFLIIRSDKVYLKDLSTITKTNINYTTNMVKDRDSLKFTSEFTNIKGLEGFGYKLVSEHEIKHFKYNYTRRGTWINMEAPTQELTDFIVGNLRVSFMDWYDAGYNLTFDDDLNEVSVKFQPTITDRISIDPTTSFYSKSNDAYCIYDTACVWCSGGSENTETLGSHDSKLFPPFKFFGFVEFDTSGLSGLGVTEADITDVKLEMYSNSVSQSGCTATGIVRYGNKNATMGSVTCADFGGFLEYAGSHQLTWGTSTGWKSRDGLPVPDINGDTAYRLGPLWTCIATKKDAYMYHKWRTNEYGFATPELLVTYEEAEEEEIIPVQVLDEEDIKSLVWVYVLVLGMIAFLVLLVLFVWKRNY